MIITKWFDVCSAPVSADVLTQLYWSYCWCNPLQYIFRLEQIIHPTRIQTQPVDGVFGCFFLPESFRLGVCNGIRKKSSKGQVQPRTTPKKKKKKTKMLRNRKSRMCFSSFSQTFCGKWVNSGAHFWSAVHCEKCNLIKLKYLKYCIVKCI